MRHKIMRLLETGHLDLRNVNTSLMVFRLLSKSIGLESKIY